MCGQLQPLRHTAACTATADIVIILAHTLHSSHLLPLTAFAWPVCQGLPTQQGKRGPGLRGRVHMQNLPPIRLSCQTHALAASVWRMHQFPEVKMSRAESEADMLRRDGPRMGLQAPSGSNGDAHSTPSSALRHSFESKRKADVNHQGHMEVGTPHGRRSHQSCRPQMQESFN